jgi:hypothetical protein
MEIFRDSRSFEKADMQNKFFDTPWLILLILGVLVILAVWQFYSLASASP